MLCRLFRIVIDINTWSCSIFRSSGFMVVFRGFVAGCLIRFGGLTWFLLVISFPLFGVFGLCSVIGLLYSLSCGLLFGVLLVLGRLLLGVWVLAGCRVGLAIGLRCRNTLCFHGFKVFVLGVLAGLSRVGRLFSLCRCRMLLLY